MKNIVLTGFMGTGKTSTGKMLASKLGCAFVDIDESIEKEYKTSISDIFMMRGENYFRTIEHQMVKRIAARKNTVIATGGGTVKNPDNMAALRENGIIICLKASADTIMERTAQSEDRPLLAGKNDDEKMSAIKNLLAEREEFYRQADYIVDTTELSPLQTVDDIMRHIGKK